MADEIELKMPQVEQQVVVNISGEAKIEKIVETLNWMMAKNDVHNYWKEGHKLVEDFLSIQEEFEKDRSEVYALELLKIRNALKAISEGDISLIIPDYNGRLDVIKDAEKIVEQKSYLPWAFEVTSLKRAFGTFETLRAYGLDVDAFFKYFN